MADKKVSELDAIAGSATAADDLFLIVDASGSVTKKITRAELNNAIEQDVLSTVDINGGTIDSTVIGGTTPAAGDFTTLGATGNITVAGNVGIGTASPLRALHVESSSNLVGRFKSTGSTEGFIQLAGSGTGTAPRVGATGNSFVVYTGDAERLYIGSGGNVGIRTASPATALEIRTTSPVIRSTHSISGDYLQLFHNGSGAYIDFSADPLIIRGASNAERMRLDDGGSLLLGTQSKGGSEKFALIGGPCFNMAHASTGTIGVFRTAGISGSIVGSISITGSSTSYNTSSDYRLKENVTADWDATTRLKQLNPVRFNFISDADTTVDGFLAHEVQGIVPEAITGTKDAMRDEEYTVSAATGDIYTPAVEATYDDDGVELTAAIDEVIHSTDVERPEELAEGQQWRETTPAVMGTRSVPDYQGIDQSKLTPLLTKALIEAVEKIEQLEARIAALEAD